MCVLESRGKKISNPSVNQSSLSFICQNQIKISIKCSDPGKNLKLHLWFNNSNYRVIILNSLIPQMRSEMTAAKLK